MDLQELAVNIGIDVETLKKILERFIKQTPGDIAQLEKGISDRDAEAVRTSAHHIKGAALNLELIAISDSALQLELMAKKSDWPGIQQLFTELQTAFKKEEVNILKLLT